MVHYVLARSMVWHKRRLWQTSASTGNVYDAYFATDEWKVALLDGTLCVGKVDGLTEGASEAKAQAQVLLMTHMVQ